MRTNTKFKCLFLFTFLPFITFAQKYQVGELTKDNDIEIASPDVLAFIDDYGLDANITDMKVFEVDNHFFLGAKDDLHGWIYLFYLSTKNIGIFVDSKDIIHACKSDNLSINTFIIIDGKIKGCNDCNHKILKRE